MRARAAASPIATTGTSPKVGDHQRGGGARSCSRTRTRSAGASAFRRRTQRDRDRRRRSRHEVRQRARAGAADAVPGALRRSRSRRMIAVVRTAGDPARLIETVRAAVRARRSGRADDERRDADRAHRAPLRAGPAVRQRVPLFGGLALLLACDRAVRPDVVQRRAADQRDRHPHGARRAARAASCGWCSASRWCSSPSASRSASRRGWRAAGCVAARPVRLAATECRRSPPRSG